jgi:signal transduction histidine kinase
MRLKTQFSILTGAVTLLPLAFMAMFFGFQQAPKDPRAPSRDFIEALAARQRAGERITLGSIQADAAAAALELKDVALLQPDGKVLISTFSHIVQGTFIKLTDLTPFSRGVVKPMGPPAPPSGASAAPQAGESRQPSPKPELRLMSIDPKSEDSYLVLFDVQPFWNKQDIRNRNILFIGLFALVLFTVSGVISFFILRSISRAIRTLEKDAAIVATGDLDHEVAGSGNHEILLLAKSINLMRLNLKDMLMRRSKMLMGVSHDLKTPIALIQGYADALADEVAADEATKRKYLSIIQDKAKQLEDLTGEIIDFLKIDGEGNIAVAEVDIVELVRSLGNRFESDARLLKRDLAWGFGEEAAPAPAFAVPAAAMNRLLVERALENLVTNSFKYSHAAGKILFRLIQFEGRLAFSVADDGSGIADEDAPYVFDAFYRGSHARDDGGHGFGLTVVKAAADLHGWTVSIGKKRDGQPGTEALLVMR